MGQNRAHVYDHLTLGGQYKVFLGFVVSLFVCFEIVLCSLGFSGTM